MDLGIYGSYASSTMNTLSFSMKISLMETGICLACRCEAFVSRTIRFLWSKLLDAVDDMKESIIDSIPSRDDNNILIGH